MSEFSIPLQKVMLLQHIIEHGGTASCQLRRPDITVDAQIAVENDESAHHIKVTLGALASSITLPRDPSTKYQSLRTFLEDMANGRAESGCLSAEAIGLMDAQESVNEVIQPDQIAYVINTINPERPYGAVVANDQGEVCAAATGSSKEHLVEAVRAKLRLYQQGLEECA